MKIALSGYGKMGKEIEKAALLRGHEIVAVIDSPSQWQEKLLMLKKADVVVDFSTPASVVDNIRHCFDLKLPVVTGTTGWNENMERVKKWCADEEQALFVGSNFSIGVNILFRLTRQLSGILNQLEEYDISLEEIHHIHKLDAPSGTAIKLAEIILAGLDRKSKWVNHTANAGEELTIRSVREDEVAGIHSLICESEADRLILRHEAKNRKGFVAGAMLAAEWLPGKKGYFEMNDLLHALK